jgi:hypothetical protein
VFANAIHYHPSVILLDKGRRLTLERSPERVPTLERSTLPAKIILGWKINAVANTLAYCDTSTITAVKSFAFQGPVIKPFLSTLWCSILANILTQAECLRVKLKFFSPHDKFLSSDDQPRPPSEAGNLRKSGK